MQHSTYKCDSIGNSVHLTIAFFPESNIVYIIMLLRQSQLENHCVSKAYMRVPESKVMLY